MTSTLTLFGIKAILRLKQAGQQALEQSARDKEAVFPELIKPDVDRVQIVRTVFRSPRFEGHVASGTAHAGLWQRVRDETSPPASAVDTLYLLATEIHAGQGTDLSRTYSSSETAAGAVLIGQWSDAAKPVSPIAHVVITAADIALEYVAANPNILDMGGSGDELLGAFADNLSQLLPDDGSFGPREHLGERFAGAFLRAGLETLSQHPDLVTSKDHVQELVTRAVAPVIAVFPNALAERLEFQDVLDALIGPAASAVMNTVAAKPEAFLGEDFAASRALGALTQGVLRGAAVDGLSKQFGKSGLLEIYRAALGVAVEQPQLFVESDGSPKNELIQNLFAKLAETLKTSPPPFDRTEGIKLASVVLESIAENGHRFAAGDEPLEDVAADLVKTLSERLAEAFRNNGSLSSVVTRERRLELARVALRHIAAMPEAIFDKQSTLGSVVGAVAAAMAEDKELLLGGDDWVEIVRVAAAEAASNPGRLFGASDDPSHDLAPQLLSLLIRSAGEIAANKDNRSVLFGATLREAAAILMEASSGNFAAIRDRVEELEDAVGELNEFVAANAERFGNKEWLRLFRVLVARLLAGADVPALTLDTAVALLEEGAA